MRRTVFAVVLAVLGLLAAGCGGGTEVQPRPSAGESPVSVSRVGPVKVTEVAEKCAVLVEDQWRGIGADQPPRPREVNGTPGCEYQKSSTAEPGEPGWSAFVAVSGDVSYKAELKRRGEPTGSSDIRGYPGKTFRNGLDCSLIADISDRGFLLVNSTKAGPEGNVDPCVLAEQVGGMAVMNLPDEPPAG